MHTGVYSVRSMGGIGTRSGVIVENMHQTASNNIELKALHSLIIPVAYMSLSSAPSLSSILTPSTLCILSS